VSGPSPNKALLGPWIPVMPCYMASQTVICSDCGLCRTLLRGLLLACGEWSTSRRSWSLCTGYRFGNGCLTSWQLWCTNAFMVALRGTWRSFVVLASPTSRNEISRQWEAPRTTCADFIWWQVVRHRWSTHLEQPTWCHPRLVYAVLNIRITVEIILVCLTTAAPVIFNWRLTNVLLTN